MIEKWALVTGASKGLGFEYCKHLLKIGFNIIGVARNTDSLKKLEQDYDPKRIRAINLDLSESQNNQKLFEEVKNLNIELLINNAGYGVWGFFNETNLERELNMIDLNIKSLHILTKLFVNHFMINNKGRVINVGSMASFTPAPVFSSYYASKSYVWSLGVAINTELKKTKSKVRVITVCPGPLKTDFWNRSSEQKEAKYKSTIKVMKTSTYAKKSLNKSLKVKRKNFVITGFSNKIAKLFTAISPKSWVLSAVYNYQRKRK